MGGPELLRCPEPVDPSVGRPRAHELEELTSCTQTANVVTRWRLPLERSWRTEARRH